MMNIPPNLTIEELWIKFNEVIDQNKKLLAHNIELIAENKKLKERVAELEARLNMNSNNSHKPPSSDGFRKPKSLRPRGGKIGGPIGHKGHTLKFSETPTEVKTIPMYSCSSCNCDLSKEPVFEIEKRQVFDLPEINFNITEYRSEKKKCPNCQHVSKGSFPKNVNAHTQYGSGIKAAASYLMTKHIIPLKRTQEIIQDFVGHTISEATLINFQREMADSLADFEIKSREHIINSTHLHADETGSRVKGKTQWLHVTSTDKYTLFNLSEKRGSKGIEEMGVIPNYTGTVIHDCYKPYFNEDYRITHALCGAHLLRECQLIIDHDKYIWAEKMQELLRMVCSLNSQPDKIEPCIIETILNNYDDVIKLGFRETPYNHWNGKRKNPKQSKAYNLLVRFNKLKDAVLLCLKRPEIPFTNNQAERDIRMAKLHQKISGSFRTIDGAKIFYRIRGALSSWRKQGRLLLQSLTRVLAT